MERPPLLTACHYSGVIYNGSGLVAVAGAATATVAVATKLKWSELSIGPVHERGNCAVSDI